MALRTAHRGHHAAWIRSPGTPGAPLAGLRKDGTTFPARVSAEVRAWRSPSPPAQFITNAYLPEPLLLFAEDGLHIDPKAGIARYGPRSRTSAGRHPDRLRVGFIGGAEQIDIARRWLTDQAKGVNGDEKNPEFAAGCRLRVLLRA